MKVPAAVWAAGLLCLQGADATALVAKRLADMAAKGLSPNGSPRTLSERVHGNSPSVVEIPEEYVKIPLDHFAKDKNYDYDGYFYNRFYVYEDGYKPGAPVFIWDVGEQSAEGVAQSRLDKTNPFRQIVDKYNGLAIVWEHRYCKPASYGEFTALAATDNKQTATQPPSPFSSRLLLRLTGGSTPSKRSPTSISLRNSSRGKTSIMISLRKRRLGSWLAPVTLECARL